MRACASSCLSCSIFVRMNIVCHPVSHVISLLVLTSPSLFQSTTRSTTWTARPSPRRHCTPRTSSTNYTVGKQRKRTFASQLRGWRKPANKHSHRLWAQRACDQRACDNFWKFSGRPLSIRRCAEREFGEQDQQAPIIEDVNEFGQIETQSLLDHEIPEMSPVDQMSYLQSKKYFDESMESNAEPDLEDGEIRKLLTSPLYAARASGKPTALFSSNRTEQRKHVWSSVFGNANLSNLSGTLLEGNKDHLLSQTRSVLAKRELHVESLNKCIDDTLQEVQNEFVESRREQTRLQEELLRNEKVLRDTQIRRKHEMGKMKRARVQQVDEFSMQKLKRKSRDHSTAHFPIAAIARTDEFHEQFWEFQELESHHGERLSHASSQHAMIPSSRSMLSRDKRLLINTWNTSELHKNVFENQCSTFNSSRDYPLATLRENEDQFHKLQVQGLFPQEMTNKIETQFQCRHFWGRPSTISSLLPLEFQQNSMILWLDSKDSKYWSCNLFWFSIGSHVQDQRRGDGIFIGWILILTIPDKWRRIKLWHNSNASRPLTTSYSAELRGRTAKTENIGTAIW